MNKYEVEEKLPSAVDIIERKKSQIDSSTRSKLSAFGATIVMSGLLPALAAYSKDENKIVVTLIEKMIGEHEGKLFGKVKALYKDKEKEKEIEDDIINSVIALKLALDAFDFDTEEITNE